MSHIWQGWLAGSAIGALMVALYFITNKQLGISQVYCYASQTLPGAALFRNVDFRRSNYWRLWFGMGIPLGALLANVTSGNEFYLSLDMGEMYEQVLPDEPVLKILLLLSSGTLMGLGARMAGGCTSGHVISGVSMLNPPSMIAGALFFAGGIIAVQLLFFLGA